MAVFPLFAETAVTAVFRLLVAPIASGGSPVRRLTDDLSCAASVREWLYTKISATLSDADLYSIKPNGLSPYFSTPQIL